MKGWIMLSTNQCAYESFGVLELLDSYVVVVNLTQFFHVVILVPHPLKPNVWWCNGYRKLCVSVDYIIVKCMQWNDEMCGIVVECIVKL
jgi:hypothetical protein